MKVMIARMNHETNTFSPVPTPLEAFGNHGPTYDEAAYRDNKGMRTAMAAFIDLAERAGAEIVTPVSAGANPSGPVAASAYDELCRRIVAAARGVDAILLDLHGAMVAQNSDDGEGDLLERVRAAAPDTPIAVALDLHANVTPKIVANADIVVGFKTYPHVDMYETGARRAPAFRHARGQTPSTGRVATATVDGAYAAQHEPWRRDEARARRGTARRSRGGHSGGIGVLGLLARGHSGAVHQCCRDGG